MKTADPAEAERFQSAGERALTRARAEGKPLVNAQEDSAKGPCTERIR